MDSARSAASAPMAYAEDSHVAQGLWIAQRELSYMEQEVAQRDSAKVMRMDSQAQSVNSEQQDASSKLIRMFFNSGAHNPVSPSAARAAQMNRDRMQRGHLMSKSMRNTRERGSIQGRAKSFAPVNSVERANMPYTHSARYPLGGENRAHDFRGHDYPLERDSPFDYGSPRKLHGFSKIRYITRWLRRATYSKAQKAAMRGKT